MGAAYALARLKASDAVPALIKVLEGPDSVGGVAGGDVRAAWLACRALGAIGDRRAVLALKTLIDNGNVQNEAEKALRNIGN